jgi:hypothetical protein
MARHPQPASTVQAHLRIQLARPQRPLLCVAIARSLVGWGQMPWLLTFSKLFGQSFFKLGSKSFWFLAKVCKLNVLLTGHGQIELAHYRKNSITAVASLGV